MGGAPRGMDGVSPGDSSFDEVVGQLGRTFGEGPRADLVVGRLWVRRHSHQGTPSVEEGSSPVWVCNSFARVIENHLKSTLLIITCVSRE